MTDDEQECEVHEMFIPVAEAVVVSNVMKHPSGKHIHHDVVVEVELSLSYKRHKPIAQRFELNPDESIYFPPDEENAKEFLTSHKWPLGLQDAFIRSCKKIPIRFILCDDSGSMMTNDGHRLVNHNSTSAKMVPCTRWAELSASIRFHADLADAAGAPTEFRLLNSSEPFLVGMPSDREKLGLRAVREVFERTPTGQTPLCYHINQIVSEIQAIESELRENKQVACVIIATDGQSTDGDIAEAMRPLQDLPVWVVVRLCTDEESVVNYWNNIDSQLDIDMDVLDDFQGEACEVLVENPWLTYGEPLQRLREFGATFREIDLLDEAALTSAQMRYICAILVMGDDAVDLPHPDENWQTFADMLRVHNMREHPVYCPVSKTVKPWLNMEKLREVYHGGRKPFKGSLSCVVC